MRRLGAVKRLAPFVFAQLPHASHNNSRNRMLDLAELERFHYPQFYYYKEVVTTMTVNGKPLDEYFPRIFSQQLAKSSLAVAGEQTFDIKAFCNPAASTARPVRLNTASLNVWSR